MILQYQDICSYSTILRPIDTVQGKVLGQVNLTHAADASFLQDPIMYNCLADLGHAFLRLEVMLPVNAL
jgi:hypothetical protein